MNKNVVAFATPIAVFEAGVLIAGALYFANEKGSAPQPTSAKPSVAVDVTKINTADEPTVGNPNAPIAMAYFSDYQCPFCSRFDTSELPQIMQTYVNSGKMRIVFKDFQFIGDNSTMDALYARAVWHLYPEKFGDWHQAMYASQPAENSLDATANEAHIKQVTEAQGMDFAKVKADMEANKATYQARIDADRAEGTALGINSTPSFVIGRQLIAGAQPIDQMTKAIDTALLGR